MKKTITNLIFLNMLFAVIITIVNIIGSRFVQLPFGLIVSSGTECFAITFLITDIISEIWGRQEARKTVFMGFILQLIVVFLIQFDLNLWPTIDAESLTKSKDFLSSNWRLVLGGGLTYLVSQYCDLLVFHSIRDKFNNKFPDNFRKYRYIWNTCSTMFSQLVDAFVGTFFIFGLLFGELFVQGGLKTLTTVALSVYAYRFILALIDTPIFLYCTRRGDK